ncbi:MAG: carbohydrate ABC transporter permease [Chlorobium sp.]|nr:carbohydrate ABC transporter permease [Chlorobium sp.]
MNRTVRYSMAAIMVVFAALSVYPLIWMAINSFKDSTEIVTGNSFGFPQKIVFVNYEKALFERNITRYFFNSVLVTSLTILLTVVLSTMLAYGLSRMVWRFREAVLSMVVLGILLPAQIVVVPVFMLVKQLHLVNSPFALVFSISAFNITMSTLIAIGFMKSIPYEMEEAGVIDGAGLIRIFFQIFIPILKPAIAAMSVNIFLNSWNEFIYALTLLNGEEIRTLPVGLMSYVGRYGTDFAGLFAAMVITSILPIAVYIIFSEQVENALTAGAILK